MAAALQEENARLQQRIQELSDELYQTSRSKAITDRKQSTDLNNVSGFLWYCHSDFMLRHIQCIVCPGSGKQFGLAPPGSSGSLT